jgi:hypothetical protein
MGMGISTNVNVCEAPSLQLGGGSADVYPQDQHEGWMMVMFNQPNGGYCGKPKLWTML